MCKCVRISCSEDKDVHAILSPCHSGLHTLYKVKGKFILVQAVAALRVDIRLTDGGKAVSPTGRPFSTPRKSACTHFC
jgi:hypothetical protein